MSNAKAFKLKESSATEIPAQLARKERNIQDIFEDNLLVLLGIRFVASGKMLTTDPKRRYADILGLDDSNYPCIIEFKRNKDQNITNQGLAYWRYLKDHKGDFHLMVKKALGQETADEIDWSTIRIICIAAKFWGYDIEAAPAHTQNFDLIEYKLFGDDILIIDPVYIGSKKNYPTTSLTIECEESPKKKSNGKTAVRRLRLKDNNMKYIPMYEELLKFASSLGDDAIINDKKAYVAVKRMSNFVSFQGLSKALRVTMDMRAEDVEEIQALLPEGAWKKVIASYKESHYRKDRMGLSFNITNAQGAEFVKPFIERSYERDNALYTT